MQPIIYHEIPAGFLDARPQEMESLLGSPSLIVLPGRKAQPLFVSVILHGNEISGILALQELLKEYGNHGRELPRSLIIFVGNVAAAKANCRRLPTQKDYNRIWLMEGDSPEEELARNVIAFLREQDLFASIDIHNNTGANPNYSCVNQLDQETLALASLFGRTVVFFTEPREVQTTALGKLCPAVTVECGQPGTRHGIDAARNFVDACLHINSLSDHNSAHDSIDLYESVARVKLPSECAFEFGGVNVSLDFRFPDNFDHLNFVEQPKDSLLGWRFNPKLVLEVLDNDGKDVSPRYLAYENEEIRTKRSLVPSMFTKDPQAAVLDCLGYFMERYPLPEVLEPRKGKV